MEACDEIFFADDGGELGGVRRGDLFPMAAETVVDDPHGHGSYGFWLAADFRVGLGCGAIYIHIVLNALPTNSAAIPSHLDARVSVFSAAGEHI